MLAGMTSVAIINNAQVVGWRRINRARVFGSDSIGTARPP